MTNTDPAPEPPPVSTKAGRRLVILHYHYFKNAGTTFDAILQQAFPGLWVTREFEGPLAEKARALKQWIEKTPQAVCFSSHTAELPPPEIENTHIVPILFIRHPLDRIRSAYGFERRQPVSTYGSQLAKEKNLPEYIEARLDRDRQCKNFHTFRLSRMFPPREGTELDRALRAVSALPIVGLVYEFDKSLARIEVCLGEAGIDIKLQRGLAPRNTSAKTSRPLEQSLADLESDIGTDLYKRLLEENTNDLALYRLVEQSYEPR